MTIYKSTASGLEVLPKDQEIKATRTFDGGLWEFVIDTNSQNILVNGTKYVMVFRYCDMQIVINATLKTQ